MKKESRYILLIAFSLLAFGCFGQSALKSYEKKKKDFTNQILKHNWTEPDKIEGLVEPAILINYGGKKTLGASKLGGTPDLPEGTDWPKFEGHSMVFFGQLNLSDIASLHQDELLPKTGILYFFSYFMEPEGDYGAEYDFIKEKAEYKIMYVDTDLSNLKSTKFPKDLFTGYHFEPKALQFELKFQIPPSIECAAYEIANLNSKDAEIYDQIISDYDNFECEETMILGTPCPMQYGADWDWAYSYLDITDIEDPVQREKIDKLSPEFINLLSFPLYDEFENIGYSNCYFGITKQDLKNKNFNNTVFIMQGT